jgi:hypothetical protein
MALLLAAACGGPMRTGTTSKPANRPDADGTCPAGLTVCGTGDFGVCVDLQSDRAHCGACDRACTQGIACQAGACQQVACKSEPTFSSQAAPALSAVPSDSRHHLALADINGDGQLDAVQWGPVPNQDFATFSVSLGLVGGGFAEPQAYRTDLLGIDEVTIDDVDHDGLDDLVLVASVLTCVEEWLGARDGMLMRAPATGVSGCLNTMAMADFSGDGRLDVVAPYKDGRLIVYLSDSLGVQQQSRIYSTASQIMRLFVRDWNGDGAPDVVGLSQPNGATGGRLQIFYNRGDGTFLDVVDCGIDVGDVFTAQVTDLDHDGRQDLITTSAAGVGVLLGRGGCSFGPVKSYLAPGSYKESRLADLDGDGTLDLVLVAIPTTVSVFLSNPDGTLRPLPPVALGNTEPTGVTIADIDGDQRPDVAVTDLTGHTQILGGQCP